MTKKTHKQMAAEAQALGLKTFETGVPCIHGHIAPRSVIPNHQCLSCTRKAEKGQTYEGKPCKKCGSTRRGSHGHCLKCVYARQKRDADKHREKTNAWYNANRHKYADYYAKWRLENLNVLLMHNNNRKARQLKATPEWLSSEQLENIRIIYKNRPDGMAVDHIVPLKNTKKICGLNVPWNMQYLTKSENSSKSNKFPTCQRSMRPAWFDVVEWCMSAE